MGGEIDVEEKNLKMEENIHRLLLKEHVVVVDILNYDILVNGFELKSRYYVHFQTNTLPPLRYWLNSIAIVLQQG